MRNVISKNIIYLLLAILIAACAADIQTTPTANVTAEYLYVYSCPSITCTQIGVVGIGDQLYVTGEDVGDWTPIKHFGQAGYVYAAGLRK